MFSIERPRNHAKGKQEAADINSRATYIQAEGNHWNQYMYTYMRKELSYHASCNQETSSISQSGSLLRSYSTYPTSTCDPGSLIAAHTRNVERNTHSRTISEVWGQHQLGIDARWRNQLTYHSAYEQSCQAVRSPLCVSSSSTSHTSRHVHDI